MNSYVSRTAILLTLLAGGCIQEEELQPAPPVRRADSGDQEKSLDVESDADVVASSERRAFDGLKFIVPESWEEVALSDFQRGIISARLRMPDAGPESTLTLSRASGGLESNLDRWRGQFQQSRPEKTEQISVAGHDATLIDLEGQFSPGFGKEASGTWRMMGIIVPLPERAYFIKLTGPVQEVAKIEDDFLRFARSAVVE